MATTATQQIALDNALVAPEKQVEIGKSNLREFDEPPSEEEILSFIKELGHTENIKNITAVVSLLWEDFAFQIDNRDIKKQEKMYDPRFTKAVINHFLSKDKSISMRNRMFMHTVQDDSILGILRFVSKDEDTQVYGALIDDIK
ncbi:hypothetical protein Tco_0972633 [Tanacetum coccineum]